MYGPTIWVLVHDAGSAAAGDEATGYHLRLDAYFSGLVGVAGAPWHLATEARLKQAVEPLFVAVDEAAGTKAAAEALLDRAASEIDKVLG